MSLNESDYRTQATASPGKARPSVVGKTQCTFSRSLTIPGEETNKHITNFLDGWKSEMVISNKFDLPSDQMSFQYFELIMPAKYMMDSAMDSKINPNLGKTKTYVRLSNL